MMCSSLWVVLHALRLCRDPLASKNYPLKIYARRNYIITKSVDLVRGLSSPLLCAPARRPAHLLGCSASPRLDACPAACSARRPLVWLHSCLLRGTTRLRLAACFGAPLDSCPQHLSPSGTGRVPTRGTSYWGHPLRVERRSRMPLGPTWDTRASGRLGSGPQALWRRVLRRPPTHAACAAGERWGVRPGVSASPARGESRGRA
jgi:hypothetical protein